MRLMSLQKPCPDVLLPFLSEQAGFKLTYTDVGATAGTPPKGYVIDHTQIQLGSGEAVFRAAQSALTKWQQFQLGWVSAWPSNTPLEVGQVVAIMGWAVGFWWLNACRIIYLVDESEPGIISRFGFAYGTLPGHVETGEERFLIEWDHVTDRVLYHIDAFSKPNHVLTKIGYPLVRRNQKRFGRDSAAAMFRAVHAATPELELPQVCQMTR